MLRADPKVVDALMVETWWKGSGEPGGYSGTPFGRLSGYAKSGSSLKAAVKAWLF